MSRGRWRVYLSVTPLPAIACVLLGVGDTTIGSAAIGALIWLTAVVYVLPLPGTSPPRPRPHRLRSPTHHNHDRQGVLRK